MLGKISIIELPVFFLCFFFDQVGLTIMDVNDSAKDFNWKTRYSNRYVPWGVFVGKTVAGGFGEVVGT